MTDQKALFEVLSDLASIASLWKTDDVSNLLKKEEISGSNEAARHPVDDVSQWRHRHLLMYHFLVGRQFERLCQTGAGNFIDSMNRLRPGDFLAVWRQVRKFRRASGD